MNERYAHGINPIAEGFYLSTFFVPLREPGPKGRKGDMIGSVFLDPQDGRYHSIIRFRWYVNDVDIFDSEDVKDFHHGCFHEGVTEAQAEAQFKGIFDGFVASWLFDSSRVIKPALVPLRCDGEQFIEKIKAMPWVHVRGTGWNQTQLEA